MTWDLATIAVIVAVYAATSRWLDRVNVSAAFFFVAAGIVAGPVLGLVDLGLRSEQVKLLAEITLVLVLFSDASRIAVSKLRREAGVPLRLLGVGLPLTIVAGAVAGMVVLPGLSAVEAVLLAVALACTDAALGVAVVTDERLPSRVRQGLNVESGLNDGLCVPLFLIAITVAEAEEGAVGAGHAARVLAEQIGYGALGGIVAGLAGVVGLRLAGRHADVEPHWLRLLTLASAGLAAGVASGLGGSIFIAAFVAGFVFARADADPTGDRTALVGEAGELFNALTFIVFGAVIVSPMLDDLSWSIAGYAVLSLTVVRGVPVAIAMLGTGAKRPTVAFLGWFGPRGLASIVFAVILLDDTNLAHEQLLLTCIAATVALSVVAHGFSASPLTNRYVGWWGRQEVVGGSAMEGTPVPEHPWRVRLRQRR